MRIKSYFAPSIQEAMERARLELGPEAMLMSSKKTAPEQRRLGAYEVVFGISGEAPPEVSGGRPAATIAETGNSAGLVRELADLRKQIETVRLSVSRQGFSRASAMHKFPEFEELQGWLVASGFSEEVAHELIQGVAARTPSPENSPRNILNDKRLLAPEQLRDTLREEIEKHVRVTPTLSTPELEQRVVVFAGPSGAGKTTALVKLALKYGVAARLPLQIISTDTLRVGGSEQLGAYARIMGVGFQAVPTMTALEQALEEGRTKKLILIDTPGFSPNEMNEAGDLKTFLNRNPHIEVQLVVPVTLRPTALASILSRFGSFHPAKLLLTHLDELESPGAVLDAAIRSGLPLSFLSTGQQIPDDLEEASKTRLADKLFERMETAAVAAA